MIDVTHLKGLLAAGRIEEAEAAAARSLDGHPDDVPTLKIAASCALGRAQPARAKSLLQHALRLVPGDAEILYHLARSHEALGDAESALAADESALRAAPDHLPARLHYALGLQRRDDAELALLHFMRVLKEAQSRGEWTDASTTPVALRPRVEHAVQAVRRGQQVVFQKLMAPLSERYGRASLERIHTAIRIYVGELKPNYPDTRQRPTFFYIPGLPTSAYFDRRLFAWIPAYEARFREIKGELEPLLAATRGRERVFGSDELEQQNLQGSDAPPTWNGYYFYRHGERREDNCNACPLTAQALDALPLIRVRDHGPEVLHSVFTRGTHLLPHRGVTNARCVSHLPLIVPGDCALRVGGEERAWREGHTVVFDDTYEHEAWNRSQQIRVVLIADLWNPHLSEVERAAVTDVIAGIGTLATKVDRI